MKQFAIVGILATRAFASSAVFADPPVKNVSGKRHPNIAAAQRLTANAYQKIVAAQEANEFDLGGHAAKAKDLLDQANSELKQAAQTANKNGK
jgi:F0F1-type ATP synthase membrane subunit b/b'